MKHLLLATSALVAFAGAAAAEVTVRGDARIGLRYDADRPYDCRRDFDGDPDTPDTIGVCVRDTLNVVNRVRAYFDMASETDSGLSFGAELQVDTAGDAGSGSAGGSFGNDNSVWISGAYGKLTAGSVDAAIEQAVGDLPEVGLTGLNFYNEMSYSTTDVGEVTFLNDDGVVVTGDYTDDATLLYEYKIGDASIYASFTDGYFDNGSVRKGQAWSLGAGYTLGNYSFGIGYEDSEYFVLPLGAIDVDGPGPDAGLPDVLTGVDATTWGISGGTSVSGITFKAIYLTSNIEDDATGEDVDVDQYGVGAEYTMANGVGLSGFWRKVDAGEYDLGTETYYIDATMYGLGASYDLGGGATLKGGIAKLESDVFEDRLLADFGVSMKF